MLVLDERVLIRHSIPRACCNDMIVPNVRWNWRIGRVCDIDYELL